MNPSTRVLFSALLATGVSQAVAEEVKETVWEDPIPQKTVQTRPNFEPMIVHPEQQAKAAEKINEYIKRNNGKRPNILLYVMDDVGWGDPGCYGGGEMLGAATPYMDMLARNGLRMTSAYAQPSSSPTRATILTGQLPVRHGVLRPTVYGEEGGIGSLDTLPKLLKKNGYVTQAIGKWHLGENTDSHPQNVGFDDFYGFLSVSDTYTEWRDVNNYPETVLSPERMAMIQNMPFSKDWVHAKAGGQLEKVKEIDIEVCKTLDTEWTKYSAQFIRDMAKSDKPFFLYHCTRGAHFDNYPSAEFAGKSAAKTPYRDTIVELDTHLGTLYKTLKETGQLENTLIFICSDNGPEHELWPDGGYTPFRGSKGSTYEGGVRVPGIVYWKGMIEGGRVSDGLFDLADLFPTILNLGGALDKVSDKEYIDGIDQTSFWLNADGHSNRKTVFFWCNQYFSGARLGEFKLTYISTEDRPVNVQNPGGFSGEKKSFISGPQLYNLYSDPKEEHSNMLRRVFYMSQAQSYIIKHLETLKKYPVRTQPIIEGL